MKKIGPVPSCGTHEWERIDKVTFKKLGIEWHGYDWRTAVLWWQGDTPTGVASTTTDAPDTLPRAPR